MQTRRRCGVDLAAQNTESELNRVGGIGSSQLRIVRVNLEKLDSDESLVGAMGPTGETVALGPFAHERRVGPPEVRAVLGVIRQEHL